MQLLPFIPEKGGAYGYIHCQKMRHGRRCEDYMMKGPLAAPATFVKDLCVKDSKRFLCPYQNC